MCGVSLLRYKLGAFAVSSAYAAVAGALYLGVVLHNVVPSEVSGLHGTTMSITFVAIIIVGGLGTVWGAVVGALFVEGLPLFLSDHLQHIPLVSSLVGDDRFLTVTSFNNLLLGVLIVVFLLAEPRGLAGIAQRTKRYLSTWPMAR
jgi:branched-chain amino acid transport system permease protein